MAVKATMIFQVVTAKEQPAAQPSRVGGWSESWYQPGTDINTAVNLMDPPPGFNPGLAAARLGTLPRAVTLVGERYQVVDPVGRTLVIAVNKNGSLGYKFDNTFPQASLLVRAGSVGGLKNVKRFAMRCAPAEIFAEGEYVGATGWGAAVSEFYKQLGNWSFRARDLAQPTFPLISISALGVVTGVPVLPYQPIQMVRILRSKDASGRLRGGRYQVTVVGPAQNQCTIGGWPWGATTGGSIRADLTIYPQVDTNDVRSLRSTQRKVGRPFYLFHGRHSNKH